MKNPILIVWLLNYFANCRNYIIRNDSSRLIFTNKFSMPEIIIDQGYKKYHLNWELIHKDKNVERYKITPVANFEKFMIIENNRPFIREVKHLKRRRIDWNQIEGPNLSPRTFQSIIDQIEKPTRSKKYNTPAYFTKTSKPKRNKPDGPNLEERRGMI